MNRLIRYKIEMGDRIAIFAADPGLAPTTAITSLFTQAATHVATLKIAGSEQTGGLGGFRGGAFERRRTAEDLRNAMRDINEIARVLKPSEAPGASEVFRMPRTRSFQGLLAAGRHFATSVEPIKALFIARALPTTFVEDLEAKIAAFEVATNQKSGGRNLRVGGTAGMDATAKLLMETVKELRAILRVHLRGNPALHEAWRTAARVQKRPTPAETPGEPETPPSGSGSGSSGGSGA